MDKIINKYGTSPIVYHSEKKYFRMERCVKQGCNMSPVLFNVYMDAVMKEVKMGMGRVGVRFLK